MKVLVLSCQTGGGHNACGRYIKEELNINNIECDFKDYFDKWLPKDLLNYLLTQTQGKEFEFCDNIVSIGDGGLHSVYKTPIVNKVASSLYVESTDKYAMYNVHKLFTE